MTLESYMVVYTGDQKRLQNYTKQKEKLPELKKFQAADAINNYDQCKHLCLEQGFCTTDFINKIENDKRNTMYGCPGKIGHHASFFSLMQELKHHDDTEWFLIVEDDIDFHDQIATILTALIDEMSNIDTRYVRLWTDKREKIQKEQFVESNKIQDNIFHMIPQWGTVGQMISKRGIETILSSTPVDVPLDIHISKLIKQLKAVCVQDVLITNLGSDNTKHKNSKLGSIIWKI
jgi:GR25 family glycosyltransferase involved in LPS biosynthesis